MDQDDFTLTADVIKVTEGGRKTLELSSKDHYIKFMGLNGKYKK